MYNNFKCRECGVVFSADDTQEVKCQACGSDNIDPYKTPKKGRMTIVYIILAFVAAVGAGIGVKFLVGGSEKVVGEEPIPEGAIEIVDEATGETIVDAEPLFEPMLELIQKPIADEKTKTYSFACKITNLPEGYDVEYQLFDFETGKLVSTTNDGKFSGVKPAQEGYKVVATMKKGDKTEVISKEFTGFDPILDKNLPKLTVAQVQTLVNQMISSGRSAVLSTHAQISPNVSIKCVGVRDDDVAPTSISKLLSQVTMGIWSGMKVESLGYDDKNQVNVITIRPIYAD